MPTPSKPNHTLFRHGLYSKYFTEAEMQSLDKNDDTELILEISLARLNLARLLSRLKIPDEKKSSPIA